MGDIRERLQRGKPKRTEREREADTNRWDGCTTKSGSNICVDLGD